ncbi:MAG: PIG-L family deacetylase [Actinomycetota bacterium]|nr:PIG-L family deacetylase [Actinomycetota bacterium]
MAPRTIILSPHLDDAVLSCWHLLSGKGQVGVVNVFTGLPSANGVVPYWDLMTGATDSRARVLDRLAEDKAALATVGRKARNLDLLDEQYRAAGQPVEPFVEQVAATVAGADAIYAPAAIDPAIVDHVLVRDAALDVGQDRGISVSLYADLPHALRFGWPAFVVGKEKRVDPAPFWERSLRDAGAAAARATPEVHRLSRAQEQSKLKALFAYRSQLAGLDVMFGGITRADNLSYEVTWSLTRGESGR